ncbi:MAG: type II toxin-antitoxin system RelE/ParE family toxin [Bacteroidales bacterium]|nr:type II toxin-antitoxin system RelE/ParE family toxin [Bacteroidales bacterium]
MALKHKWHNNAQIDFDDTLAYIFREFGEKSAENFLSEVSDLVDMLCFFPEAGLRYKDLIFRGNEVRIFHMRKSSIVYYHDDKALYVIAFWNNRNGENFLPEN